MQGRATPPIARPNGEQDFREPALEVVAEEGVEDRIEGRVCVGERGGDVDEEPEVGRVMRVVGGQVADDHLVDPVGHPADDVNEDDRDHQPLDSPVRAEAARGSGKHGLVGGLA